MSLDLVGGAHAFVHTASRYDECQLVQLPLAHLNISLDWLCRSTPQCHHEVVRCVPSKLPQLPEGQVSLFIYRSISDWFCFHSNMTHTVCFVLTI